MTGFLIILRSSAYQRYIKKVNNKGEKLKANINLRNNLKEYQCKLRRNQGKKTKRNQIWIHRVIKYIITSKVRGGRKYAEEHIKNI